MSFCAFMMMTCLSVRSKDKIIKSTKDLLNSIFDMKYTGLTDLILGIKIIKKKAF